MGAELRRLRACLGLTGDQVIASVGWPAKSKLSRLENGRSRPDLGDVLDLLDLYRVDECDRDRLVAIARDAANTGWLREYPVMTTRQRNYAELETGCDRIAEYAAVIVPGLLQTPEYARLRLQSSQRLASSNASSNMEAEVAALMARQTILTRPSNAPDYEAVVDENALLNRGAPATARAEQIARLAHLASLPNVTIRVLRCESVIDSFYLPYTGFSIYHFPDPDDPETIAVETLGRELVFSDRECVKQYTQVFEWISESALDAKESKAWLSEQLY
ncbi:helix-turn-helix domain-containing protein [Allorhizocola rhizosphaerae]|uniref:helix-turn-helix domain-containing protein n=1 Tax=Allorhizocola rhizosphaerae TaxID=1872709 RepID=UPI0013C3536E|nr:helix-turn-helix transcriptional regulator [Allorhizocola rhizosphaerae]